MLELDIRNVDLGPDGLEPFFWPVSFARQKRFNDRVHFGFADLLREAVQQDQHGARELLAIYHILLPQVFSAFAWELLRHGVEAEGLAVPVPPPDTHRQWASLATNSPNEPSFFFDWLGKGFPPRNLQHYLSKFRLGLARRLRPATPAKQECPTGPCIDFDNGLARIRKRKRLGGYAADEIIVTKRSGLIRRHAEATGADCRYEPHTKFFRPVTERDLAGVPQRVVDADLRVAIAELIEKAFVAEGGFALPPHVREGFEAAMVFGLGLAHVHMLRLRGAVRGCPAELWTGSAGNIWDRMLRIEMLDRGARVCGHDHAGGVNYMQDPGAYLMELSACSQYVTFSEAQARAVRDKSRDLGLFQPRHPDILGLPPAGERSVLPLSRQGKGKRIMYMGGLYRSDMCYFYPSLHDRVMVDFEARLFARLKNLGYEIIFKAHPENPIAPSNVFRTMPGLSFRTEPFEEVAHEADIVLFSNAATTTFNLTMGTDLPMALVDFGQWPWIPEAYADMSARCAVVPGHMAENNRLECEWDDLGAALERAPSMRLERAFLDHWL